MLKYYQGYKDSFWAFLVYILLDKAAEKDL